MNIIKIAAFSDGDHGGNPAGVVLTTELPTATEMQSIAADVGYSETAFAQMLNNEKTWRVRYFSPESEVPFCGHATIALGAALAEKYGHAEYSLTLNEADISVEGTNNGDQYLAALKSPPTHHTLLSHAQINDTLTLFGYSKSQLSNTFAPARINGGADHYVIPLQSRSDLASMSYNLDKGREFMQAHNLVTIMFVVTENKQLFHARNAFASGGVLEDPATGAAAAAFTGYLRDSGWTSDADSRITIIQGQDMGSRSVIDAEFSQKAGSSIRISGATRNLS